MDRAEALRALIKRMMAGKPPVWDEDRREFVAAAVGGTWGTYEDAFRGSLDAVALLESPLKARGWSGPWITPGSSIDAAWTLYTDQHEAHCADPTQVEGQAPEEPRARLLAVLLCKLWEAENADPR